MISGVKIKPLKAHIDDRGRVMEILRSDDSLFERFGQVYITTVNPGVVKAWHYHRKQTDHFACLQGTAKVVLYDGRDGSKTRGEVNEFFMGERKQFVLRIPPLVMHGFKAIGNEPAFIINCPTELFDYAEPDEYRLPWESDAIPYDWDIKMG